MSALVAESPAAGLRPRSPFDLGDDATYRAWRARKLADRPRDAAGLVVDVADPQVLGEAERAALLRHCARCNMAIYRTAPGADQDKGVLRALAAQLGLLRLDANWLADEDGISSITVRRGGPAAGQDRGAFIPYTDHALKWHTDGYYHPGERRIRAMLLHCARPAVQGGENLLLDHELAYIAVRDASPRWVRALMADDAMTIPARTDAVGAVRPAQSGPVFSVDPRDGTLHMRYTARTRSIGWKQDQDTLAAVAFLEDFLAGGPEGALRVRLDAGMGLVSHNVLHDRSAFVDDPARPRLVYRARYLDRLDTPWRSG